MSHDIAEMMGQATMAYQGTMPWHGLGTKMDGNPDVWKALEAAKLNWRVAIEDMYLADQTKVKLRRAVRRDVDGKVIATVGNKYTPLQNADAFGTLQPACEKFGITIETAGALGLGEKVWMLAKLPDRVEVVAGDYVDGYFLVMTGHNGKIRFTARLTPVRAVCANTIAIAIAGSKEIISLTHNANINAQMKVVEQLVTQLVQSLKQSGDTFAKLASKKMDLVEIEEYIADVLGIDDPDDLEMENPVVAARFERILQLVETGKGAEFAPNSAWNAFNAVTEYVDHVRPAEANSTKSLNAANRSAVFGKNMKLKARALQLAKRIAA